MSPETALKGPRICAELRRTTKELTSGDPILTKRDDNARARITKAEKKRRLRLWKWQFVHRARLVAVRNYVTSAFALICCVGRLGHLRHLLGRRLARFIARIDLRCVYDFMNSNRLGSRVPLPTSSLAPANGSRVRRGAFGLGKFNVQGDLKIERLIGTN